MTIDPIVSGLLVGAPTLVVGLLGILRAFKADRKTQQFNDTALVIKGLQEHVDNLQEDNKRLREELERTRR